MGGEEGPAGGRGCVCWTHTRDQSASCHLNERVSEKPFVHGQEMVYIYADKYIDRVVYHMNLFVHVQEMVYIYADKYIDRVGYDIGLACECTIIVHVQYNYNV